MKHFKEILPYFLIIIVAFIIFSNIFFNSGYLLRTDNSIHQGNIQFLEYNLLQNYKISGWNPFDALGTPFLTYIYILAYLFTIILNLIFLIPLHLAYKIILFISFFTPSCLLYLITSKKFNKKAAFSASILFLFQYKIIQEILEGLFHQYFAMIFLLLFFYYLDKYSRNLTLKKTAVLAILFSLTTLAHIYVALAASYLFLIFFIFRINKRLLSLAVPILSFFLLSFYIFPILETSSWLIRTGGWALASTLSEGIYKTIGILFSLQKLQEFSLQSFISIIPILLLDISAIGGIFYYLKKRDNYFLKINLWFLIISAIIGTGFWYSFLKNTSFGTIPTYRFLTIGIIPVIIFSAHLFHKIKINKQFLVISSLILIIFSFTYFQPGEGMLKTSENSPELKAYFNTLDYLKNEIDLGNTRIAFQSPHNTLPTGVYTPLASASIYLKTPLIGTYTDPQFPISRSLDLTQDRLFNTPLEKITQEKIIEKMKLYNIKYIVPITPKLTNKLTNFKKIKSFDNFTIFSLEDYHPEWVSTSADYKLIQWQPSPTLEIDNTIKNNTILIKIAHHPYWEAYLDNEEVNIIEENNLMKVNLKEGPQTLILKYKSNKLLYLLLSLIGVLLCIYLILIK